MLAAITASKSHLLYQECLGKLPEGSMEINNHLTMRIGRLEQGGGGKMRIGGSTRCVRIPRRLRFSVVRRVNDFTSRSGRERWKRD